MSSKVRDAALAAGVDLACLPSHIAMIMDGNGRWARSRGLGRLLGHREGYRTLREVLLNCSDLGIRYLTVYAFSVENWRRPEDEVGGLFALIERAARDELKVMQKNGVRVRVAGRLNELPIGLREALEHGVETTKGNEGITFTLAVNYGGRAEIVDAMRKIIEEGTGRNGVSEELIAANLYNPDIPDPDLMIRTAGEMRWSNFLLWQSAYAELYVTDATWPDFKLKHLLDAVNAFQHRTRKFGGVVE